jgi:glutaminyl-peptide cyclotransferase
MKTRTHRAGSVSARSASRTTLLIAFAIVAVAILPARAEELTLEKIPFNGARAYDYLNQLCDIGPRVTASRGMKRQQELLTKHFEQLGAKVTLQEFIERQGGRGNRTKMANLIVEWHPEAKERILLCAHYDTRPFPDRDPANPQGTFVGANDGGSGVALLMELGNEMPKLKCQYGVDFVFFDAEEFVYDEREKYFIGSETFARRYAVQKKPRKFDYRWGVLLDMVGDADLQLPQERNSISWSEVRPLVAEIWGTAARLGLKDVFVPQVGMEIRDDHLELFKTGKIPTCDIIDFDYGPGHGYWHTEQDIPAHCSALSLAKVGWVISEWLKTAK